MPDGRKTFINLLPDGRKTIIRSLPYGSFIGTSVKRRNDEIKRLNDLYVDIVRVKHTLQKCLKYMCQTEPYRMLKNWSYEMEAFEIDEPADSPQATEVCIHSHIYIYTYIHIYKYIYLYIYIYIYCLFCR